MLFQYLNGINREVNINVLKRVCVWGGGGGEEINSNIPSHFNPDWNFGIRRKFLKY